MRQKIHQLLTYALVLSLAAALIFGSYGMQVFAQAEVGTLSDLGEGGERILTSNWTTLAPGQQLTYQVAYDGDEQPISIWMNSLPAGSVEFEIWTDDRLADLAEDAETEPLGRGTPMTEDTGFTNWQGGSPEAETYFVVASNLSGAPARFLLNASSPALALDQPGAVAVAPVVPADPNIAVVTTDALNVRSGPSTTFPILATIPNGTQMTVLGRNSTNTWLNVQLADGMEGWVTRSLTSYNQVSPNIVAPAALPVAAASVAATTTVTTTATSPLAPTAVVTATELGEGWQVLSDGEVDWYTFQYRGGDLPLTVWMDMEPFEDADFTVVSADVAESIMAGTAITPTAVIGSGRANPVQPGYLFWQAEFPEADTFYVMVEAEDGAGGDVLYSINALGPGVGRVIEPLEQP